MFPVNLAITSLVPHSKKKDALPGSIHHLNERA